MFLRLPIFRVASATLSEPNDGCINGAHEQLRGFSEICYSIRDKLDYGGGHCTGVMLSKRKTDKANEDRP